MSELRDIFGVVTEVGDKIAAGMSMGQSSVLRVGEIIRINEGKNEGDFSVRVKWTHNGPSSYGWDVKESTILIKNVFSYAKFVKLNPSYVSQFPADIEHD